MNQQLVCGVNAFTQQISGDAFEAYGGTSAFYEDANGSGQIMCRGQTTPNKFLKIGFDTTNNHGYIDAEWSGTASEPIYLNPTGQNPVIVGYSSTYSNDGNMLQVNGVGEFNGNLVFDAAGQTVKIKGGSNAASGTVTLASGAATVATTAAVAGDWVGSSLKTSSGTPGTYAPDGYVASTGTITFSGLATDNSTYTWWLVHPNQ